MKDITRYSWGPLLLRQRVDPYITNQILNNIPNRGVGINADNLINIERREQFNDIEKGYIQNHLKPYVEIYLKQIPLLENLSLTKWELTNAWVNIYKQYHFVPPHIHEGCDISFVLFLKLPKEENLKDREGNLIFTYGEESDSRSLIRPIVSHNIVPQVGELYIFPNNLNHYTLPMSSQELERISMSGNIKII